MKDSLRSPVPASVNPLPVTPQQWRRYLTDSDAFFAKATGSDLWGLDDRQRAARWLGFDPPPSLRGFLLTTDGWSRPADWVGRLCPCGDIEWFRDTPAGTAFIDEASRELSPGRENKRFLGLLSRLITVADGDDVWLVDTGEASADGEYPAYPLTLKYGVSLSRHSGFSALFAAGRSEVEESVG